MNSDVVYENTKLMKELDRPITGKFEKRKVHLSFKDNIWGADLEDMQLISKFNKWIRFLLYVIEFCSKNVWDVPLKDKNSITITNTFQKILDNPSCKPNKIWVDKGSKFYNRSMKSWFEDDIEIYLTHNERDSAVAEGFIGTLRNIFYECITSTSKNVYIDKLADIVNAIISI